MGEMADYHDPDYSLRDPLPPLEDDEATFDPDEGPDEDIIPFVPQTEQPRDHINWLCTGVAFKNHAKKSDEPHMLPHGSKPEQPTTDESGRFMVGKCRECKARTVWKRVTL